MDLNQYTELSICLRDSAKELAGLQLVQAAKWSLEALNGLYRISSREERSLLDQKLKQHEIDQIQMLATSDSINIEERDAVALAIQYFQCKEFQRCSNLLKKFESSKAIFLRLYSQFLNIEKTYQEEDEGIFSPQNSKGGSMVDGAIMPQQQAAHVQQQHQAQAMAQQQGQHATTLMVYSTILKDLENYMHLKDPFLNYLCGIILIKEKNVELAQEHLIQSLIAYPFNWSCWTELQATFTKYEDSVSVLQRFQKNHKFNSVHANKIMLSFFNVVINQEYFQRNQELQQNLDYLLAIFPNFSFLQIQKALIAYHALDYGTAEEIFDLILAQDPLRLDDMDIYSNILYVMEKKSKLSFLAQFASHTDKFRPETCCIIANYYSLRFEHEKSIMYYKRAITLNKDCLSAWTLMGHEFVELKNSHAAIECYRRAVDINNRDYRAWYGLGQAYEFLDMHLYSLFYYQKACSLKPLDKRMWQAMGSCYEKLKKYSNAIKSYEKALNLEKDSTILYKLGLLYDLLNDTKQAQYYMKLCLAEEMESVNDDTSKAKLWLAKFEASFGNWEQAYKFSSDLQQGNIHDLEEARNLAREARLKMRTISTSSINM